MSSRNNNNDVESKSKVIKIVGLMVITFGIILVISGIASLITSFTLGPNMGMDFDEFSEAMRLSSNYSFIGIGLLTGGMFLLLFGICFTIYGGISGINEKFLSRSKIKDYGNDNPYLKGAPSKETPTCPYCKAKIQDGLNICSECGTEL